MSRNTVTITDTSLSVEPHGLDKIWSYTSRLEFPLAHVRGATHDPGLRHEPKGWRGPGLQAGSKLSGTFHAEGTAQFWNISGYENTLVITLGGFWWWMHRLWEGCLVSGVRFDASVHRDAVARVVAGESASAVARDVGCRRGRVSQWCQEAGVELVRGPKGGTLEADRARRAKVAQAVLAGRTLTQAGAEAGVTRDTARRYWHDQAMETASSPASSRRSPRRRGWSAGACSGRVGRGQRVSDAERVLIAQGRARGESAAAIARSLGRCRQTVWREIARNTGPGGVYRAPAASEAARERLARPKTRRLDTDPVLRAEVVALLEDGASPRQISARLRWAHPDNESMRISHEQIYQALYVQGAGSLRQQLRVDKALRSGRTRRLPRSPLAGLPRRSRRPWIEGAQISVRPPQAADRSVPGHWEGDLVIGAGGRSALITLVERTSRFVLIHRLGGSHDSQSVTTALQTMVADLPRAVRASITWDQGSEMAQHAAFTAVTDIPVYFADPHSPWQRPTNENTNRLIREYLPKGTSFQHVTDTQVQAIQDRLNRRPRLVLNGQTPTEKLNNIINGANTT